VKYFIDTMDLEKEYCSIFATKIQDLKFKPTVCTTIEAIRYQVSLAIDCP